MKTDYRILFLEDREEDLDPVADLLKREYLPCELCWVRGREGFLTALKDGWSYDLLLVGEPPPDLPAQEALSQARKRCPGLPVVLLPRKAEDELAADLLRLGATDVVARTAFARLAPVLRRAVGEARKTAALKRAEADIARVTGLLRTVLEASSEGILVVDLAGQITTYNRKFMSLCGIPEYVMAPMNLERVLLFLQDQFADPEAFMTEARALGDHSERKLIGFLHGKDQRAIEAFGRSQRVGRESVGEVFSFRDVTDREQAADPLPEARAVPPDLAAAARSGRMVPWFLTQDELVISEKGLGLLGLARGELPGDLAALEALIHPEDLDRLRRALEHPQSAPFELRMRKGDGSWLLTRWNLNRGLEGYRGVFTGIQPDARAEEPGDSLPKATPRFNFLVRILQG
jgi:PAS domain S-box-containing protein